MQEVSQITDRDDHYLKYANGVVYDSKTGFEWIAGPGRNMNWYKETVFYRGLAKCH